MDNPASLDRPVNRVSLLMTIELPDPHVVGGCWMADFVLVPDPEPENQAVISLLE